MRSAMARPGLRCPPEPPPALPYARRKSLGLAFPGGHESLGLAASRGGYASLGAAPPEALREGALLTADAVALQILSQLGRLGEGAGEWGARAGAPGARGASGESTWMRCAVARLWEAASRRAAS
jgi:hypothetical protein